MAHPSRATRVGCGHYTVLPVWASRAHGVEDDEEEEAEEDQYVLTSVPSRAGFTKFDFIARRWEALAPLGLADWGCAAAVLGLAT